MVLSLAVQSDDRGKITANYVSAMFPARADVLPVAAGAKRQPEILVLSQATKNVS